MVRSALLSLVSLCLAVTAGAQEPERRASIPAGAASLEPPTATVSSYGPGIVPASMRNVFGNDSSPIPFGWSPCSYQQVFHGNELPTTPYEVAGVGLRRDDQYIGLRGYPIEIEMKLGFTSTDRESLKSNFAANYDIGPPTVVVARRVVAQPDIPNSVPTDPTVFFHQIRFDRPWTWSQVPGRNLLIEVRNYGNGNYNQRFTYMLDASTGVTTTSLASLDDPHATSGAISRYIGLVMCFLDKVKPIGGFVPFGNGCPGTGGFPGDILPVAMRSTMGNSNNFYPFGKANMRYQQVFAASDLQVDASYDSLCLRQSNTTNGRLGGVVTFKLELGHTSYTPDTLTSTFDGNLTSGPLVTVFDGSFNIPTLTGRNSDPNKFTDFVIKFNAPWRHIAGPNKNLIFQCTNKSTADVLQFMDANLGGATSRLYAESATATTGTMHRNAGLVIGLGDTRGWGRAAPRMENSGNPAIGQTFGLSLRLARPSSAALLILGGSNQSWGPIPLPHNLAYLGAPYCDLLVSLDVASLVVPIDALGSATVMLGVPNDPKLVGLRLHSQFFVADRNANAFGFVLSNGGTWLVGEP